MAFKKELREDIPTRPTMKIVTKEKEGRGTGKKTEREKLDSVVDRDYGYWIGWDEKGGNR